MVLVDFDETDNLPLVSEKLKNIFKDFSLFICETIQDENLFDASKNSVEL